MLKLARSQLQDHPIAMTEVFVIRNQFGHFWGKGKAWVNGSQPRLVLRTPHRDEAVNTLFELSSKDFELRGEVLAAELGERGEPVIEPSRHPLPEGTAPAPGEAAAAQTAAEPAAADTGNPADDPADSAPESAEPVAPSA
jgi:hypothetical protein